MYSVDKYKIIAHGNEVIAISTYAGKTVKGIAKADPRDEFDVEKGKALAIARCAAKIAMKRQNRAKKCLAVAQARLEDAQRWVKKMTDYSTDAIKASQEALDELYKIEQSYK